MDSTADQDKRDRTEDAEAVTSPLLGIFELCGVLETVMLRKCGMIRTRYTCGTHQVTGKDRVWASGTAVLYVYGDCSVTAREHAEVHLYDYAKCEAFDYAKVHARGNSKAELFDFCTGTVRDTAEMTTYDNARMTANGGIVYTHGKSHATVSYSNVTADDDSTISLVAESTILALGRAIITQGPFVDTSDVVCGPDAKLITAWRPDDKKRKGSLGLPSVLKPSSGI